ncbi:MAG TPA: hypothetical protein VEI06_17220 [Gemmatimonadaceae bacterium]|nr:hypothetical protein [Gemmatimonadaceae bacterium]
MTDPGARAPLPLGPITRLLSALYGALLVVFGCVAGFAQFSLAMGGCMTCWLAIGIMLAMAVLGLFFLRAAARG